MAQASTTSVNVEPSDAVSAAASDITATTSGTTVELQQQLLTPPSCETIPAVHSYQIKPALVDKFKAAPVKEIIRNALTDKLAGKTYNPELVKKWTTEIANDISSRVIELEMKRYKHVVQVIIGEQKGAGVKSGVRCIWDAETDGYTSDIFTSDSLFCLAAVYAIYLY